jgi:hypothetical protein
MGDNAIGDIGNENQEELTSIYKLNYFEKKNLKVKKIVCGDDIIFLTGWFNKYCKFLILIKILECGKLFAIGCNEYGCIGDGTTDECSKIKQIKYFLNIFIDDFVCGKFHCLSISNKREIYSWGSNEFGQIGNGKSGNDVMQLTPIKIFKI